MVCDHASVDGLKHRQLEQAALSLAAQVTTQVLMDSNAGKLVRRLTKHANASVASAAGSVVSSWKEAIAREQRAALGDAAGMPAGPLPGHPADRRSTPVLRALPHFLWVMYSRSGAHLATLSDYYLPFPNLPQS